MRIEKEYDLTTKWGHEELMTDTYKAVYNSLKKYKDLLSAIPGTYETDKEPRFVKILSGAGALRRTTNARSHPVQHTYNFSILAKLALEEMREESKK